MDKNKNSKKAFQDALKSLAGGVNSPVRAFKNVLGDPLFIKKGDGAYLIDIDENRYIDYVQSWGPLIFGNCDKDIENAVLERVKNGLSFGAPTLVETELADEIIELFPFLDKVRFVSSGTEAVMSAIRLARGYTGRDDFIKFEGCYHGHSDSLLVQAGSGLATFNSPSSPGVPEDLIKHTFLAKYNNIESVKECFKNSKNGISAIIIEPIAGNMGLIPADIEFLEQLRKLCDENKSLLIFDEVMSGFRASLTGSQAYTDVKPDILTLGKVIGGGMPVGMFGANNQIMSKLSPDGAIYQAGTLSGNPVAMSAGLIAIQKLKKNPLIYNNLEKKANKLMNGFKKIAQDMNIPLVTEVRGSMFGFFFSEKQVKNFDDALKNNTKLFAKFHSLMLDNGIYIASSSYETGFISTKIDDNMIDETLLIIRKILKEIV